MQEPFRIAILDDYQKVALSMAPWASIGSDASVTCFHDHVREADQLVARLQPFDAVVTMRERTALTDGVLSRLPRLKLIVSSGKYNAAIDSASAQRNNIAVAALESASDVNVHSTIELAWGLIFALARDIPRHDASVRNGGWQLSMGTVLWGKTLGIVGLGNFGPRMIPIARALNMRVVAWSRHLTAERAQECGAELLDRQSFYGTADVITIHIQLSRHSRGYVGRDDLRTMKSGAYLINTSRGQIVDEPALIEALREGWIAGAGLDVFDNEPLPLFHPLRTLPRTVLAPHVGFVNTERYVEYYGQAVECVRAFRRSRQGKE